MRTLLILCAALATASAAATKSLPSQWTKCKKDDPKIGSCLRNAILVAVKDLSEHGAKEYGVFPMDPLFMSHVGIAQGNGPVSIELEFTDINIYGLKDIVLPTDVIADVNKIQVDTPVLVPKGVTLKGRYKINGKVLVLPIKGEGECELNLSNVTASVQLKAKKVTKGSNVYAEATSFSFNFETTKLKIRLENLFNGDKRLSDQMNIFLNENWPEILKELKPGIQDAFGEAFKGITNRIFTKVPYEKLFAS